MIREFAERRAKGEKVGTLSVFKALAQHENEEVRETAELLIEETKDSVLSLIFLTVSIQQLTSQLEIPFWKLRT